MGNSTQETNHYPQDLFRVADLIDDIGIAMMVCSDSSGQLRSRPMQTQQFDAQNGSIWFFASLDSLQTGQVEKFGTVNLSYACPEKNSYVSVSGDATVLRDRYKMTSLWTPALDEWFPEGLDDPAICLIQVRIDHAEYWDSPSNKAITLYNSAKAFLKDEPPPQTTTHGTVELNHGG